MRRRWLEADVVDDGAGARDFLPGCAVAAGSSVRQVGFTVGNVTTARAAKFTATLGSSSMSVTITVEPLPAPTLFDVNLLASETSSLRRLRCNPARRRRYSYS